MTEGHMQIGGAQRAAEWGHWGLTFQAAGKPLWRVWFAVGPQGPVDGCLGTPLRESYRAMMKAWVETGAVPEKAVPA